MTALAFILCRSCILFAFNGIGPLRRLLGAFAGTMVDTDPSLALTLGQAHS